MQNFYFRSVMLVFIMIGILSILGCSMYPAISPVAQVQQVVEDEHNIANYEVEQGSLGEGNQADPQLEVDFENNPIENIVDENEAEQQEETEEQAKVKDEVEDEIQQQEEVENKDDALEQGNDDEAEQSSGENGIVDEQLKQIALTFDDGPDLKYTPQVLDILNDKNIKATFFIVGIQIKKYPEVVQRMVDEGHLIANHTYHHPNLKSLSKDEILKELDSTDELIESIVGFRPTIMRPPYGSINDKVREIIKDSGREVVLWNIDPRDWASTPVDEMYENVMTNARSEGNILFHSFGGKQIQNTVDLLPSIIDALIGEGYTFVTVDNLEK